jgi:N,N-dimethylformamidase
VSEPDKTIVAYGDRLSAAPGDVVAIKVSAWGGASYRADLVRLLCGDGRGDGSRFAEELAEAAFAAEYPARRQQSQPGSYGFVASCPGLASFGVVCALWPTALGPAERAVAGTWSEESREGFALGLDAAGVPVLRLGGEGGVHDLSGPAPLSLRRWVLLGASYDAESGLARLFAFPVPLSPGVDLVAHSGSVEAHFPAGLGGDAARPLWFAAANAGEKANRHFDGKIGALRITRAAVAPVELAALANAEDPPDADPTLLGFWDFSGDMAGDRVVDRGPRGLDATLVQMPTRAVTGHRWNGEVHDWRVAPGHYDAIHFHADDLADAGWDTDFEWRVPEGLQSGIYAVRLQQKGSVDHVPVFVRPPRGRRARAVQTPDTLRRTTPSTAAPSTKPTPTGVASTTARPTARSSTSSQKARCGDSAPTPISPRGSNGPTNPTTSSPTKTSTTRAARSSSATASS